MSSFTHSSQPRARAHQFLRRSDYDRLAEQEHQDLERTLIHMTRDEWLASTEPTRMLAMLRPLLRDEVVPDRDYRAFACACCRRMWQKPQVHTAHGPDYPACADEVVDAVRTAEAFCDGRASPEQLRRAHERVAAFEQAAMETFAHANYRLGDSTSGMDLQSAFYEAYPASAARAACARDIADTIGECVGAAARVVGGCWDSGSAARREEERRQAVMVRERWAYPEAIAQDRLDILRFRRFRNALARQQQLSDERWNAMQSFARRIEGLAGETLRELCSEQMRALARILPAEELRDLLLGAWMLAGPASGAGIEAHDVREQARRLTNEQLMGLGAGAGKSLTEGSLERWSCQLFFCQLTAAAYGRLKTLPTDTLACVSRREMKTLCRDQLTALPGLPGEPRSRWFWHRLHR